MYRKLKLLQAQHLNLVFKQCIYGSNETQYRCFKTKDAIDEVGKAALNAPNYLPENPNIIAASQMIGPGETTELIVNVPEKRGISIYLHLPGHY